MGEEIVWLSITFFRTGLKERRKIPIEVVGPGPLLCPPALTDKSKELRIPGKDQPGSLGRQAPSYADNRTLRVD
jgi:hypothetical protein